MTTAERIFRGFNRLGLLFVALCAAFAVLAGIFGGDRTPENAQSLLTAAATTAALGYGILAGLGWAISGFFRDKDDG